MQQFEKAMAAFRALPPSQQQQIREKAKASKARKPFIPNPGPQVQAYHSLADVLLFGGSPGGGKSALEIGLALNEHHRSLIVRKNFTDLDGLIDTAKKLVGSDRDFVGGSRPKYKKRDGGVIHFAGLASDGGIGGHQGVDHDLICIDEAAQIPEAQARLLMGWLRTDRPGQRCRVVLGSNPPLDSTGEWLNVYFGPWLNPTHPRPAKPGELRYFLPTEDGADRECSKDDTTEIDGIVIHAQSRTFIPSKFTDNPHYDAKEYAKTLAGLPQQVRDILTTGNFMLARKDDPWQVIPTDWIRQAQARWKPEPPRGVPMCAIGVDVANGGDDNTVLAPRHDGWYAPLVAVPGRQTPTGSDVAGLVVSRRRDHATVIIDLGGGYGGSPFERLKENEIEVVGFKGAEKSNRRTQDGKLGFVNKRSEIYWRFREALDPDQPQGSPIALPDDPELVADLTAPTFEIVPRGIQVIPKEKLVAQLGRSPDRGDAVVMAWCEGGKMMTHYEQWRADQRVGGKIHRTPAVSLGPRRR